MAFCLPGVSWFAGILAGIVFGAVRAVVTARWAVVIFFRAAGMALFAAAAPVTPEVPWMMEARFCPAAARRARAADSLARAAARAGPGTGWSSSSGSAW